MSQPAAAEAQAAALQLWALVVGLTALARRTLTLGDVADHPAQVRERAARLALEIDSVSDGLRRALRAEGVAHQIAGDLSPEELEVLISTRMALAPDREGTITAHALATLATRLRAGHPPALVLSWLAELLDRLALEVRARAH